MSYSVDRIKYFIRTDSLVKTLFRKSDIIEHWLDVGIWSFNEKATLDFDSFFNDAIFKELTFDEACSRIPDDQKRAFASKLISEDFTYYHNDDKRTLVRVHNVTGNDEDYHIGEGWKHIGNKDYDPRVRIINTGQAYAIIRKIEEERNREDLMSMSKLEQELFENAQAGSKRYAKYFRNINNELFKFFVVDRVWFKYDVKDSSWVFISTEHESPENNLREVTLEDYSKSNQVENPSHYNQGKFEVIDVIEDWKLGFCLGNTIKYIARAGHKDPSKHLEDLKKASWYLSREISKLEKEKGL